MAENSSWEQVVLVLTFVLGKAVVMVQPEESVAFPLLGVQSHVDQALLA